MKIDIRKAFDTINWEFVREVLKRLGFPSVFVGWIMQCISTTSYSISINGALHGFFKGQQGIRQGDPISHFLFVLCLEYLSTSLKQLKDSRDSKINFTAPIQLVFLLKTLTNTKWTVLNESKVY